MPNNIYRFLISFSCIFCLLATSLCGQSRSELEKKRSSVNRQIKTTTNKLVKTKQSHKSTLEKIALLKQEILGGQKTIESLRAQTDSFDLSLDRKMGVVEQLELNQQKLKQKWIYLRHLSSGRSMQFGYISKTQESLIGSINKLEGLKIEHQEILSLAQQKYDLINIKIKAADQKAYALSKKERLLYSDLKRKKRYKKQMSKKIEKIIHQQIAESKRKARDFKKNQAAKKETMAANQKKKDTPRINYIPSLKSLNNAFSAQKGSLISPVYQGEIIGFYGKNKHPSLKDVYIYNNGIDIQGQYNSVIRNVYQGVVVSVFSMPGQNNAVMINHGDYYTTYTNIAKVYVKKGEKVRTGGQIGTIGRGVNGAGYIMHFEIWKNKNKENPRLWLKK